VETRRLEYDLPQSLIATRPAEPRDSARLLVASRRTGEVLEHAHVRDLPRFLKADDALGVNVSRVAPARFQGVRADSGGRVEGLFLDADASIWRVMLRSNGRLRPGALIDLLEASGEKTSDVSLRLLEQSDGVWSAEARSAGAGTALSVLERLGAPPLPPYILRARREAGFESADDADRLWYQTVYADPEHVGSVAAPTAGLHFTPELLERLRAQGVNRAEVVLHVGAGTFKPVEDERLEQHPMHEERYVVPRSTAERLAAARAAGGRIVCVGTTTVRALESLPDDALTSPGSCDALNVERSTDLLIAPGHRWRHTDALMTNFHLPRSTLLALVAALIDADDCVERLLAIYREAIAREYRFYSYGDAMLLLPE
jgi:S-adenosylmethionine:tRNA ribosyltransferase-isomerase